MVGVAVEPSLGDDDVLYVGTVVGTAVCVGVGNEEGIATDVVGFNVWIASAVPEGLCVPLGVDGGTRPVGAKGDWVGLEMVGNSVEAAFGTMVTGAFDEGIEVVILGGLVATTVDVSVVGITVGDNIDGMGEGGEVGRWTGAAVGRKDEAAVKQSGITLRFCAREMDTSILITTETKVTYNHQSFLLECHRYADRLKPKDVLWPLPPKVLYTSVK